MSPPRALTLRPARTQEAQAMAQMSRDLIEAGLEWRYTPRRIASLIDDPDFVALVACDALGIQGLAIMQFGDAVAHLTLLCVRANHQRQGVGRRMHQWLLESARVAGIVAIEVELRADNAAALAFYRRQGFTETHLVPSYYGPGLAARRMVRRLGGAADVS